MAAFRYHAPDGRPAPSVTEVVDGLKLRGDLSMIPPAVLQGAAERGTTVHEAILAHNVGATEPDLPAEWSPYLDAWKAWASDMDAEPAMAEEPLVAEVPIDLAPWAVAQRLRYLRGFSVLEDWFSEDEVADWWAARKVRTLLCAGQPDFYGAVRRPESFLVRGATVVDAKTRVHTFGDELQTLGYVALLAEHPEIRDRMPAGRIDRIGVELRKDGTYRQHRHASLKPSDFAAALVAWSWMRREDLELD